MRRTVPMLHFDGHAGARLPRRAPGIVVIFALALLLSACSVKHYAINKLGDSLANTGTTFASDDDPELVGGALPFSLKLIESLLAESPRHRGLLLAACSGFTQYSYVYVQQAADQLEDRDIGQALASRVRARKLYLRARDYGLRGLDAAHPGFRQTLHANPKAAVRTTTVRDVPLLYWTAASWGAAMSISKDDPEIIADQVLVEAMVDRAFALDPNFDHGAIDAFLISYESARQGVKGDFAERSRRHFERAVELTEGQLAAPFIAMAETVSVSKQNRKEFESLLKQALAINPDARPEWRLSNLVMQRRARWLLQREDDLFLSNSPAQASSGPAYVIAVEGKW